MTALWLFQVCISEISTSPLPLSPSQSVQISNFRVAADSLVSPRRDSEVDRLAQMADSVLSRHVPASPNKAIMQTVDACRRAAGKVRSLGARVLVAAHAARGRAQGPLRVATAAAPPPAPVSPSRLPVHVSRARAAAAKRAAAAAHAHGVDSATQTAGAAARPVRPTTSASARSGDGQMHNRIGGGYGRMHNHIGGSASLVAPWAMDNAPVPAAAAAAAAGAAAPAPAVAGPAAPPAAGLAPAAADRPGARTAMYGGAGTPFSWETESHRAFRCPPWREADVMAPAAVVAPRSAVADGAPTTVAAAAAAPRPAAAAASGVVMPSPAPAQAPAPVMAPVPAPALDSTPAAMPAPAPVVVAEPAPVIHVICARCSNCVVSAPVIPAVVIAPAAAPAAPPAAVPPPPLPPGPAPAVAAAAAVAAIAAPSENKAPTTPPRPRTMGKGRKDALVLAPAAAAGGLRDYTAPAAGGASTSRLRQPFDVASNPVYRWQRFPPDPTRGPHPTTESRKAFARPVTAPRRV